MSDMGPNKTDLTYFTYIIGGRTHGGWYRLLPADCIEVLAICFKQTLALDGRRAEETDCGPLEEFVRVRQRLGQPVPALAPEVAGIERHRTRPLTTSPH